jgi:hypothetical protein
MRFAKPEGGICVVKWPFVFTSAGALPGGPAPKRPQLRPLADERCGGAKHFAHGGCLTKEEAAARDEQLARNTLPEMKRTATARAAAVDALKSGAGAQLELKAAKLTQRLAKHEFDRFLAMRIRGVVHNAYTLGALKKTLLEKAFALARVEKLLDWVVAHGPPELAVCAATRIPELYADFARTLANVKAPPASGTLQLREYHRLTVEFADPFRKKALRGFTALLFSHGSSSRGLCLKGAEAGLKRLSR